MEWALFGCPASFMKEIWKTVTGYPAYKVSNYGRVKSISRTVRRMTKNGSPSTLFIATRILAPALSSNKMYLVVSLRNDLGKKTHKVHRLVATEFVKRSSPDLEVLHKDDNGFNNIATNLKWGTRQENMQDMYDKNRQARGSGHGNALLDEEDVLEIVQLRNLGKTMRSIAIDFGVSAATVSLIMTGDNWSHVTGIEKRIAKPRKGKRNADRTNQERPG
jgi:hypothetical protein